VNALADLQTYTILTDDINEEGALVTATEVYDHVSLSTTGFYDNPRRSYRVNCNDGRPVKGMNDLGEYYPGRRDRLHFSSTQMNDQNSHGLMESVIFKIFELMGVLASKADYAHLRIIDNNSASSDFEGIHVIREYFSWFKDYNGDFLRLRNLPDGNIHGYRYPYELLYDGEDAPYGQFNSVFNEWNNGWDDLSDGCSSCAVPTPSEDWIRNHLDLDHHFAFMAAQEMIANNETNYPGQHNYIDYYNPETNRWYVIPDDLNATMGTPRDEDGFASRNEWNATEDVRSPFKEQLLSYDNIRIDFENKMREGMIKVNSWLKMRSEKYIAQAIISIGLMQIKQNGIKTIRPSNKLLVIIKTGGAIEKII